jgi:hypothetical protein
LLVGQPLFRHELDEGARAVAALLHFATVGVENAIAEIATGVGRLFHQQDLVGADAEAAVAQQAPLRRREVDLLGDAVDDDEVIAGAVHFGEFEFHG